jgi:PKD repeat protein
MILYSALVVLVGSLAAPGVVSVAPPGRATLSTAASTTVPSLLPSAPAAIASTGAPTALPVSPRASPIGAWLNVTTPASPSARYSAALGNDPTDHGVVMFGGISGSGYPNDTWVFSNGTWSDLTPTAGTPPSGRYGASLTYDARDGYTLLTGGEGGSCYVYCNDTWEFASGHWSPLPSPGFLFQGTRGYTTLMTTYDSADGYVLAISAGFTCGPVGTWTFAGGAWTNLTLQRGGNASTVPPCAEDSKLVDDPANHGVLLFGGWLKSPRTGVYYPANSTWFYSNGSWTNLTAQLALHPPNYDYGTDVVFDPAAQRVLFFASGSTWTFNGTWQNVTAAGGPPRASYSALGWDGADNVSVLFGGLRGSYGTNATWEWTTELIAVTAVVAPNPVDVGAVATFTATSEGGIAPFRYAWQFGDTGTSSAASPGHLYNAAGTYTANLTVQDAAGTSRSTQIRVAVLAAPSAAVSAEPNPSEVGVAARFTAGVTGGTGNVTYAWEFGDGTAVSSAAPTHTYLQAGNYSVTVWANDTGGGTGTANLTERVHAALAVQISESPATPDLGELVNFTANVSGGVAPYVFSWAFGDGGTGGDLSNISHIFTTNGPFSSVVTVTDGIGGTARAAVNSTVALNLSILATWAIGAAPLAVAFTSHVVGGVPGYTYAWTFGDGATSASPSPDHVYRTPGYYTADLTVVDRAARAVQALWNVYVAAGGGPLSVAMGATPATVPIGGAVYLTATVSGGIGGYVLHWSNGSLACQSARLLEEACAADRAGSYTVAVSLTDSAGHAAQGSAVVAVGAATVIEPPHTGSPGWSAVLGQDAPWILALIGGVGIGMIVRSVARGPSFRRPPARSALYDAYALSPGKAHDAGASGATGTGAGATDDGIPPAPPEDDPVPDLI